MSINWNIVLGKAAETIAGKEDEYRNYATDYFLKKFEIVQEEKKAWSEKNKAQEKALDQQVTMLKREGLSDSQIGEAIKAYKENFYSVIAGDIEAFKGTSAYKDFSRNDPTGESFRTYYSSMFDQRLPNKEGETTKLKPLLTGLLDKFPVSTATPDIPQSVFGFDYTSAVRKDIEELGKGTESESIPTYDGGDLSEVLRSTIIDTPSTSVFTNSVLEKQIFSRLQQEFADLKTAPSGVDFAPANEQDLDDRAQLKKAMKRASQLRTMYEEKRKNTNRYGTPVQASLDGSVGMTDQQVFDSLFSDTNNTDGASAKGKGKDPKKSIAEQIMALPETHPISIIKDALPANINGDTLQKILQLISSNNSTRAALSELNLNKDQLNAFNDVLKRVNNPDDLKKIVSVVGTNIGGVVELDVDKTDVGKTDVGKTDVGKTDVVETAPPRPEDIKKKKRGGRTVVYVVTEAGKEWDELYGETHDIDGKPKAEQRSGRGQMRR